MTLERQLEKFGSWLEDIAFTCQSQHYTPEERLDKLLGNLNNISNAARRVSKQRWEMGNECQVE
jgi:hypothetical protein